MDRFIADLQRERARSGVLLEEMVRVTKVPRHHLLALEEGRFHDMPGGIFRKGILRSYLQVVGVDAAPWIPRFECLLAELDAAGAGTGTRDRRVDELVRCGVRDDAPFAGVWLVRLALRVTGAHRVVGGDASECEACRCSAGTAAGGETKVSGGRRPAG